MNVDEYWAAALGCWKILIASFREIRTCYSSAFVWSYKEIYLRNRLGPTWVTSAHPAPLITIKKITMLLCLRLVIKWISHLQSRLTHVSEIGRPRLSWLSMRVNSRDCPCYTCLSLALTTLPTHPTLSSGQEKGREGRLVSIILTDLHPYSRVHITHISKGC